MTREAEKKRLLGDKKPTGKLAFMNTLIGTPEHGLMMRMNNCISGDCLNCHWSVMWSCYNKLRERILQQAQKQVYEYLKSGKKIIVKK